MKRAAFGPDRLATQLAQLLPGFPRASLCVAFSGGADSTVLLHALAALRTRGLSLRAVHVDHRLQPASADWARACRRLARVLRVPSTVLVVDVKVRSGDSLEARARDARYAAFVKTLRADEVLVTAHHLEDQAETVLLQALRGAGVAGLAAMPRVMPLGRGLLVRPLLGVSRDELRGYAAEHALQWVDDPSNEDIRFDRNYLRNQIMPRVLERWPGAAVALARTANHLAEARSMVYRRARLDAEMAADGADLSVVRLRTLPLERRHQAIRYWLGLRSSGSIPDTRRLREMAGPLLYARRDANPEVTVERGRVVRFKGRLQFSDAPRGTHRRADTLTWSWQSEPTLELGAGRGRLELRRDAAGPLSVDCLPVTLFVKARQGGERLRPRVAGPSRTAKSLLQSAKWTPEDRSSAPFVYADAASAHPIAVGDRWYDASVQAGNATAERARLIWKRTAFGSRSTR